MIIFSGPVGLGAHLVGGEISYTCLGGNTYEITMRVFRDCAGGGAQLDNQANLAIYDQAGTLIQSIGVNRGPIQQVNFNPTGDPCILTPAGLCTEWAAYIDTVSLPPIVGGYDIVHQRCCRNAAISNLVAPGTIGNTYSTSIPSMDTLCNSSPRFDSVLPSVLCLNQPFSLPLNVSEPDGDSVSFQLCEIFEGGGRGGGAGCNSVIPNPPCAPPFTAAVFSGSATFQDPIPSIPPVQLDARTGIFSGNPTTLGTYVLGICLQEWRDGAIISTVRLDYQFNVADCPRVTSDMLTAQEDPAILCDGLTVQFQSQSPNASSLLWNFGDPTSTSDTSRATNPQYTYPFLGRYNVTLVANPGTTCSDTIKEEFHLKYLVKPELSASGVFCLSAQNIDMMALGTFPLNHTISWQFAGDADTATATGRQAPKVTWASPGYKKVRITVNWDACSETVEDSVLISGQALSVNAGPDQTINRFDKFTLQASEAAHYYWYADSPVEMSNPFGQTNEVIIRSDKDTVTFFLRVQDELGCEGLDSLRVFIKEDPFDRIANVITPNGDGKNDRLDLSAVNPRGDCNLSVLNRWGQEVYAEANYQNDWNGLDKGTSPLSDGTYYIRLSCAGQLVYQGGLTILRP